MASTFNDIKADLIDGLLIKTIYNTDLMVIAEIDARSENLVSMKNTLGVNSYIEYFNKYDFWNKLKEEFSKEELRAIATVNTQSFNDRYSKTFGGVREAKDEEFEESLMGIGDDALLCFHLMKDAVIEQKDIMEEIKKEIGCEE